MSELEKVTTIVESSLKDVPENNEFPFDQLKRSLKESLKMDEFDAVQQGLVKQKNNKEIDVLKTFLELIYNDVNEINSKQTGDDKIFFNINKKILLSNLQNSHEILKMYKLNGDKLLYTLLGTLIQYVYERRSK
tara:strand:- start:56107 stop:56508 length:402 start_codon:yes stop_codon:yes gene_type:complete